MSEDTPGVIVPESTESSSPEQQTIPKYRLDEEIARRRQLEEQLSVQNQILRQTVPQRASAPEVEPDWLRSLKEENPAAYKAHKLQDQKLKQLSAANFTILDTQDRMAFMQEFGSDAAKRLPEIEGKLEELRQRGIHNYNRGQIFVHLVGAETIQKSKVPKAPNQVQAQAPVYAGVDAPSSDVRSAGTVATGSASAARSSETLEEMEQRLSNQEF